jgi:hypothetical protein
MSSRLTYEDNADQLLPIIDKMVRLYRSGEKTAAIQAWRDAASELRSIRSASLLLLQLMVEINPTSCAAWCETAFELSVLIQGGELSSGKKAPVTQGGTTVIAPTFDCTVGDYLYFEPLTEVARGLIEKYGHWWAIISGRAATRPGRDGKHQCWYMQTIGHGRQGLKKPAGLKVTVENVWWFEKDDENFILKKRHRGLNFDYKDYL